MSAIVVIIYLAVVVLEIAAMWKVFVKAGEPGWAAIIPIYNTLILLKIIRKPWWWIILFFIPLVNIVFLILIMVYLAQAFGKGGGFAVGLILLSFIFIPILGFGSAQYTLSAGGYGGGYGGGGYGGGGYPPQGQYPPQGSYAPQGQYPPPGGYPPQGQYPPPTQ